MLRNKKDVDRHVQDIFRKLQDERERTLRCCKIAELYLQVGELELAKHYLSRFLSVRKDPKAHSLMGQVMETLGQKNNALVHYKTAFELDAKQELVLKICEIMADTDVDIDANSVGYWIDKIEKYYPSSKVLFKLKEKVVAGGKKNDKVCNLKQLILAELSLNPTDEKIRIRLLKHCLEYESLDVAYQHFCEAEESSLYRNSIVWYQAVCDLLQKCKIHQKTNWKFWTLHLSSLERYLALAVKESIKKPSKHFEIVAILKRFDQELFEGKQQGLLSYPDLTDKLYMHFCAQLYFYMACILLRNPKQENYSSIESLSLLLTSLHVTPLDPNELQSICAGYNLKVLIQYWYREGCLRCSQSGHVLKDYFSCNNKDQISDIEKFCTGLWKERIYQKIFSCAVEPLDIKNSYFVRSNNKLPPMRLISDTELRNFDEAAQQAWVDSLHHQIWPFVDSNFDIIRVYMQDKLEQPQIFSKIFPRLQYSAQDFYNGSPTTLCLLDIDAFLNATALCSSVRMKKENKYVCHEKIPKLPADLTSLLCTDDQDKWWNNACKSYRGDDTLSDIREMRQHLQRGLEVLRCVGDHGLDACVLIHLARLFNTRASRFRQEHKDQAAILALERRSEMYYSVAIPILERLLNGKNVNSTKYKFFDYKGAPLNHLEIEEFLEESKLVICRKLMSQSRFDEALEYLLPLKSAQSSFEQGKIYMTLSKELVHVATKKNGTESRRKKFDFLSKARNCFSLTLERLRRNKSAFDQNLSSELFNYLSSIDKELNENTDLDEPKSKDFNAVTDIRQFPSEIFNSFYSKDAGFQINNKILEQSYEKTDFDNIQKLNSHLKVLQTEIGSIKNELLALKEENSRQSIVVLAKLDELIRLNLNNIAQNHNDFSPYPEKNVEEDYFLQQEGLRKYDTRIRFPHNIFMPSPRLPYSHYLYTTPGAPVIYPGNSSQNATQISSLYGNNVCSLQNFYRPPTFEPTLTSLHSNGNDSLNTYFVESCTSNFVSPQTDNNQHSFEVQRPTVTMESNVTTTKANNLLRYEWQNNQKTLDQKSDTSLNPRQSYTVPHNYQILMPSVPTAFEGKEPAETAPAIEKTSHLPKENVCFSSQENVNENEYDPIPDFVPIIPLPAEVSVVTGEENETILFSGRAKLYRFVNKEWKERGIGNVKLLKDIDGRVRLLMRREQILKICANHMLTPDMELSPMPTNDKAFIWVANDFADEEIKLEKLCIRFKTTEEAYSFQESFDKAKSSLPILSKTVENKFCDSFDAGETSQKNLLPSVSEVHLNHHSPSKDPIKFSTADSYSSSKEEDSWSCKQCGEKCNTFQMLCILCQKNVTLSELFQTPKDSWECQHCYVRNSENSLQCVACHISKNDVNESSEKVFPNIKKPSNLQENIKFSFRMPSSLEHQNLAEAASILQKDQSNVFSYSNQDNPVLFDTSSFTFGTNTKSFNFHFESKEDSFKSQDPEQSSDEDPQDSDDIYFEPLVPLPDKVDVITGEENENVLFCHRAKLYRYDTNTKEWKERGIGDIKLLRHLLNKNLRLIMRREQVLKVCLNHIVNNSLDMKLKDDKTWMWSAGDFSEGEIEYVQIACRFKNSQIAQEFKTTIEKYLSYESDRSESFSSSQIDLVTPQLAELKKLLLPDDFYDYIQKPKCPGCAGCSDKNEPLLTTESEKIMDLSLLDSLIKPVNYDNEKNNFKENVNLVAKHAEHQTLAHIITTANPDIPENVVKKYISSAEIDTHFLPTDSSMSFSYLASQSNASLQAFKTDPNFVFHGAGASVFGTKSDGQKEGYNLKQNFNKNHLEEISVEGDSDTDPYFEPIIPLPEMIEVRTGEEDETKVFCERAKLYRYDAVNKEWKERGTGEMKILYHSGHKTYRLLLRREQVHKVVCNILVTPDLEVKELTSSDRAWVWAGINYIDETPALEKLAIKFKTPELSRNFKMSLDAAQLALKMDHNRETDNGKHNDSNDGNVVNSQIMFESSASLFTESEGGLWQKLSEGNLRIIYNSDIFRANIVFEDYLQKKIITDSVINKDTVLEATDMECSWTANDSALNPAAKRKLKAVFSSSVAAKEFSSSFINSRELASKADMTE